MTEAAKTLKEWAETENLSEHMQERVDNAIEHSETLEHFGTLRLDAFSQKEKQDRLIMNQRPKLSYEKWIPNLYQKCPYPNIIFPRQSRTTIGEVKQNNITRNIEDPVEFLRLKELFRESVAMASSKIRKSPPPVASCL